jgi:hypothetical protein
MEVCGLLMIFVLFFAIGRIGFLRILMGATIVFFILALLGAVLF